VQESLKFSIITPTLFRPSLVKTCESVNSQPYTNWEHLVIVDDPSIDLKLKLFTNPSFLHPNRRWFQCTENHHNVGNTCRSESYDRLDPTTDYILYLDDDNYYSKNALSLLNDTIISHNKPNWGTFPMLMRGRRFFDPNPRKLHVDTGQLYHKPVINDLQIRYLPLNEYCGDGIFTDWLNTICPPVLLPNLPELTIMPVRSYGAPISASIDEDPYVIVIPNKYEDVIQPFFTSLSRFRSKPPKILIVADGHNRSYGFNVITAPGNFIFSKSANLGIKYTEPYDVILMNDDVRLLQLGTFDSLFKAAYSDPSIGILSPLIDGGCGNSYMSSSKTHELWFGHKSHIMYRVGSGHDYISFVCVYLKRQMLNQIGLMDENFSEYGKDDADMNIRATKADWKVAITDSVTVRHGEGGSKYIRGRNWNTSFARKLRGDSSSNRDYFFSKYPDESRIPLFPQPHARSLRTQTIRPNHWKQRIVLKSSLRHA
jgi:GT2 family glycosyltransferase